jgi:outer membrane murein-binding lipoprotein Lpp
MTLRKKIIITLVLALEELRRRFLVSMAVLALLGLAGCAHPIDGVVLALNASQQTLTSSHQILSEQHRSERDTAVEFSHDAADARKNVAEIHTRYRSLWEHYEQIRRAWIAAASLTSAAKMVEATGGKPSLPQVVKAAEDVAVSLESFAGAVSLDIHRRP